MDRPQYSDLVTALEELSWSDVKRMAIHLDESILNKLLKDIEWEYPIEERLMYTMKAWLERDCGASWAKVVSALRKIEHNVLAQKIERTAHVHESDQPVVLPPVKLQPSPGLAFLHQESEASASLVPAFDHSCTDSHDVSGGDRTKTQARKIDEEQHIRSITAPSPVTPHGQTESDPSVVSPVELQPSPGPDSLHQLRPENEATVIRTRREPAFDHSPSVSQDTTEQETSDCPTVTQPEISAWRRERQIFHDGILVTIAGVAVAAAGPGNYVIPTYTGILVAMIAFGVKLCIVFGVSTVLRKLAVFAAVAAVVVVVLVGAGTARTTGTETTTATASRERVATASVTEADKSVIDVLLTVQGIILALGAVAFAVLAAAEVVRVLVSVVAATVTVGVAGVMAATAVISATAAMMTVAAAGAATTRGPSQAAAARAAAAVVAVVIAVVTAAVGSPVYNTVAATVVAIVAAVAVAVESPPAVELAAAVTVGTVIVAEAAAVVAAFAAVAVEPPVVAAAAIAVAAIIAAVALKLTSILNYYLY